jgi:hypothetical protein
MSIHCANRCHSRAAEAIHGLQQALHVLQMDSRLRGNDSRVAQVMQFVILNASEPVILTEPVTSLTCN